MSQMKREMDVVDWRSAEDLSALKSLLDRQFTGLQRMYRQIYNDVHLAPSAGGPPAAHTHDGDTLQHDGVTSNGGAFPFSTTGGVTFNQSVKTFGSLIVATTHTPASASATGTTGTIAWDASYIYVCVATNTWKRVAIDTWGQEDVIFDGEKVIFDGEQVVYP